MTTALRIEIFPADLDVTTVFYTEVLDFTVERDERNTDSPYVALRRAGAVVGAAQRPAFDDVSPRRPVMGVELVLEVDDIRSEHLRVAGTGWPLVEALTERPWGLSDFRILDPDGYYWRITSA